MAKNLKFKLLVVAGLFLGIIFLSAPVVSAKAVDLYFSSATPEVKTGDIFIVIAKLASLDEAANALEGYIVFDKDRLEIVEVSTGGSAFSLWLKQPVFSNERGDINFIGGVPGGYKGGEAEIIKIVFKAKQIGLANVNFEDRSSIFSNDGKGTKMLFASEPLVLNVKSEEGEKPTDAWQSILAEDKTAPLSFEVNIGRDPTAYGNQYFLSFFTVDDGSGMDYYEVKEGDREVVKTGSPYLLRDQSLRSIIKVTAVDKAGNSREVILPSTNRPLSFYYTWGAVGILSLMLLAVLMKKLLTRRNKNKNIIKNSKQNVKERRK